MHTCITVRLVVVEDAVFLRSTNAAKHSSYKRTRRRNFAGKFEYINTFLAST